MLKCLWCNLLRYHADVFFVKIGMMKYLWYSWLRHHPEVFMVQLVEKPY